MKTLYPISTLPDDATRETVQLYRTARGCYGGVSRPGGVEEVIPCKDFAMTIQDAECWCPRE